MNVVLQNCVIFILLLIIEIGYFWVAKKLKIYDLPNCRSSHSDMTIRGGGMIFYFAVLLYFILTPGMWELWLFLGITIVSVVSFCDDIKPIDTKIRLLFQIIGFAMILYQLNVFNIDGWKTLIIIFVCICILNVYNFMDGVNGMTGIYSLVTLCTLLYINEKVIWFVYTNFIVYVIFADLIFLFFNFRKKAVCFAGDVGSICMGCIIIYLIARLIIMSPGQFSYMVFLIVYGADGGFTVIRRLFLRKNIFHPHRSQIFQLLSNEGRIPQVMVSSIYAALQLTINIGFFHVTHRYLYMIVIAVILTAAHISIYLHFDRKFPDKLIK